MPIRNAVQSCRLSNRQFLITYSSSLTLKKKEEIAEPPCYWSHQRRYIRRSDFFVNPTRKNVQSYTYSNIVMIILNDSVKFLLCCRRVLTVLSIDPPHQVLKNRIFVYVYVQTFRKQLFPYTSVNNQTLSVSNHIYSSFDCPIGHVIIYRAQMFRFSDFRII